MRWEWASVYVQWKSQKLPLPWSWSSHVYFCISCSSLSLMSPKLRLSSSKSCQHQPRCNYLPQRHISCSEHCCSMRPFQCLYGILFHVSRVLIWSEMCVCLTGPLTKEKESEITRSPASNTRRLADKNLGPMLPITKELLRDFYMPFNEKLAKMLRNDSFLWESSSQLWASPLPFTAVKKTTDVSASDVHLLQVPI